MSAAAVRVVGRIADMADFEAMPARLLMVDAGTGNDSTAARGTLFKPFATPLAAMAAALAGDTIEVYPGAYTTDAPLAKHLVNWHFLPGASVTFASDVSTLGIWDDGGAAMTFAVSGAGTFVRSTAHESLAFPLVRCSHASSVLSVEADSITTVGSAEGECSAVYGAAGTLDVRARAITVTGSNVYGVWWDNGTLRVRAGRIDSGYGSFFASCATAPTGDAHVQAEELYGTVFATGANPDAASWVRANIIRTTGNAVSCGQTNRLYVEAQKLFGSVACAGGLLYLRTDKISAVRNGTGAEPGLVYVTGGTARISAGHLDPGTFTGEMMKVTGGVLLFKGGDYTAGASANGFEHVGGTSRLTGTVLDTSAAAAKNPVTVSAGGLTLDDCTLVANAGRDSITAAAPQTVTIAGTFTANRSVNANVTLAGVARVAGLQVGENIPVGSATPVNVSFGGTYGTNAPGSGGNLKWSMYYNQASGDRYGIGMSGGLMEYQAGTSGSHEFFVNAGTLALTIGGGAVAPLGVVSAPGQVRCGSLGVGNSAAATTPGAVVKKIQIFDAAGNSLGFIPVYSSIT